MKKSLGLSRPALTGRRSCSTKIEREAAFAAADTAFSRAADFLDRKYAEALEAIDAGGEIGEGHFDEPVFVTLAGKAGAEDNSSCPICGGHGACYYCGNENTNKWPSIMGGHDSEPIDEVMRWMAVGRQNVKTYSIIVHDGHRTAIALSQHEKFDEVQRGLTINARKALASKPNASVEDINQIMKDLSDENFSRNPMVDQGTGGEADWPVYKAPLETAKGILPVPRRPLTDGIVGLTSAFSRIKSGMSGSKAPRPFSDTVDDMRAIVGSFRYTYQIKNIDLEKETMTVEFKAYNKLSHKSLTAGTLDVLDNNQTVLHQFFNWTKTIDISDTWNTAK